MPVESGRSEKHQITHTHKHIYTRWAKSRYKVYSILLNTYFWPTLYISLVIKLLIWYFRWYIFEVPWIYVRSSKYFWQRNCTSVSKWCYSVMCVANTVLWRRQKCGSWQKHRRSLGENVTATERRKQSSMFTSISPSCRSLLALRWYKMMMPSFGRINASQRDSSCSVFQPAKEMFFTSSVIFDFERMSEMGFS